MLEYFLDNWKNFTIQIKKKHIFLNKRRDKLRKINKIFVIWNLFKFDENKQIAV
jgi:hypothetical protein